ncbi:IPT/TIG domain-containing protein [Bacteroides sp.]|uniref:IPT/TIG domain-containing protein n=1 Tax=Bacteroides sp. TaxID=29523 RepID=UPI0025C244D7|nr:IPT/TIG domain-containing protein [Bacteroides sp.]
MRRIYNYILSALFLSSLVSCDGQEEEVILMQNQNPVVTVTSVSDAVGYEGNEFTIYGTNFGIVASDVEAYVGNVKLQLISCEDEELAVKVPEGATAGRISVVVYGQRVDTQLMYDVLGVPGITSVIPLYGFVDDVIKFNGHDLGVSSAHYTLLFNGKEESAGFTAEPEMESFSVKVPTGAQSGAITLAITDKPVNVPGQFTVLQRATVGKVQNAAGEESNQGLAGSTSIITGTNLKPELLEKDVELPGEWKAEFLKGKDVVATANINVEQSTNEKVVLIIPETLAAGDYKIAVFTPFEEIKTRLDYTVSPMPLVTGISKSEGYVNAEVTIQGTDFGSKASELEIKFGETVCEAPAFDEKGNIVVRVPAGLQAGENTITLTIQGVAIPMGKYAKFEVYDTPEIYSVEGASVFPYGALVKTGGDITIKGKNFGTDASAVTVMLGETQVSINGGVATDAISITVPSGFTSGKLLLKIKDVDVDIEGPELAVVPADGDITKYVLKNSVQPFQGAGYAGAEWDREGLYDWEKTNIQNGGGLQYPAVEGGRNPDGCMALHQWGKRNNKNGKMWQKTSLPKGKYRIDLGGISLGKSNGYANAALVVCEGTEAGDIPEYDNGNWITGRAGVKGEIPMTIGHQESDSMNFELTADMDNLIVGFVVWADNTVWATFTSVTVHLVTE